MQIAGVEITKILKRSHLRGLFRHAQSGYIEDILGVDFWPSSPPVKFVPHRLLSSACDLSDHHTRPAVARFGFGGVNLCEVTKKKNYYSQCRTLGA